MFNSKWVFLYTIISGLIALCIFLYGYVPVFSSLINSASYQDAPITIDGFSVYPKDVYNSHVQKLILIVVDSLSIDFLTHKTRSQNLPYTMRLIHNGNACLVPCHAPPPTTNMKKIKTLATGTTSSFIETILTFGVEKSKTDSIFRQAKENKLFLALHGAETWTQLFPEYFHRVETINAFGISDHSEVQGDANVTETLIAEMDRSDWNWLLLHYMGLKHFALDRYSNPKQLAIKLRELDNVIKYAHTRLGAQTNDYMILIVGDTGIGNFNDPSESYKNPQTIAPYIVFGKPCPDSRPTKLMEQLDLAPTLAVLTGLPIPASSYGSLNSDLLNSSSDEQLLYALHYNTARLINLTSQLNIKYPEDHAYLLFQNAVVQHGKYLQSAAESHDQLRLRDTISTMYTRTAESLSKRINDFLNTSDVTIQYLAVVMIFEAMIILVNQSDTGTANKKINFLVMSVTNLLILTWVLATGMSKYGTSFIHMPRAKGFVIATVAVLMLCNSYVMSSQRSFLTRLIPASITMSKKSDEEEITTVSSRIELATSKHAGMSSLVVLLVLGTIFQAFSLLELSYIKWENSVWFFLWTSVCFFIIHDQIRKLYGTGTRSNDHELSRKPQHADEGIISIVFSTLIMHRTLMAYTTVEYWLSHSHNPICASICLLFGLVLLAFTCSIHYEPFAFTADKIITRILLGLICCSIYMANAARGNVLLPYYPKSEGGSSLYMEIAFLIHFSGRLEILLFWFTWTFIIGYGLGFCTIGTCYKGLSSARELLATAITCWACFAALLTRPHKVLLIPIEMLFGQAMSDVFRRQNQSLILSHVWLGHLFFYYQGYTYSLDSVDRATGLLFSKNVSSLIFGVLLVMNTFSAPILSYLICVHGILTNDLKKRASRVISEANLTYGYCRFLLLSVYLLGMLVHRHNEWFWSILCPKLLYEITYTFFIAAAMIAVQITGIFHDLSFKMRNSITESME